MIKCKLSYWRTGITRLACDDLQSRLYCHIEFQLDVENFDEKRLTLVITACLDLDEYLTIIDPKWAGQMCSPSSELR
jgi:hypothetical protein